MRPVRVLGLYLVIVFLGGALIAPWFYFLTQAASSFLPGLHAIAAKSFPRFLNRSLLILVLGGLIPFLRASDLCSWRALGFGKRPGAWREIGGGFLIGFIMLACIVALALASGTRRISQDHSPAALIGHAAGAALSALIVAPLEELVFRGALFGALRKSFHWTAALVLSSGLYALAHFLEPPGWADPVHWNSGLSVLAAMVTDFGDSGRLIPCLLNLTLVGLILGMAYYRTGALYFSMGLHAGWIFWLKMNGFATHETNPGRHWPFGTDKLIDGWLAFGLLALMLALLNRALVQTTSRPERKEERLAPR
jgi:membrane protease YdiL (CAAX protease family)